MEYKQYFLPDGRAFDSVFMGTGGDQDFGFKLSDGRDVGRVYQRANATLNSGYYRGNDDIGHFLLSRDAIARGVARNVITYNSGKIKGETLNYYQKTYYQGFYIPVNWYVEGGSGNFSVNEFSSDDNAFGDVAFMNTGRAGGKRIIHTEPMKKDVKYDVGSRVISANIFAPWDVYIGGQNMYQRWQGRKASAIRCRFTDNVTGVSYVTEPFWVVNIDMPDNGTWAYLGRRCDFVCSCDRDCSTYGSYDGDAE